MESKRTDPKLRRQRGYSLLEVAITLALVGVVTGAVVMVTQTSTSALGQVTRGQKTQHQLKRALHLLELDLKSTSISRTTITTQTSSDELRLQVINHSEIGDSPRWGYYNDDDDFEEDWYAIYSVSGTNFILQVFDSSDDQQGANRIICTNVNTGVKGFELSRAGDVVTMTLRIEEEAANSDTIAREQTTSLRQRMN